MRRRRRPPLVIALRGAETAGADGYVSKPFSPRALPAEVKALLPG